MYKEVSVQAHPKLVRAQKSRQTNQFRVRHKDPTESLYSN